MLISSSNSLPAQLIFLPFLVILKIITRLDRFLFICEQELADSLNTINSICIFDVEWEYSAVSVAPCLFILL